MMRSRRRAIWPRCLLHGQIKLILPLPRTEFYDQPTILPTVRESSIKLDLHRRDFTINALSIRLSPEPAGELLDYYNGERDLQDGLIRVLHSLSFVDDPTRMMRAIRFEQRLNFHIEPRTVELFEPPCLLFSGYQVTVCAMN